MATKKNYTRTISLVGNASTRGGAIEFETRKADKPGEGSLALKVRIEGSLADGKQVIGIGR